MGQLQLQFEAQVAGAPLTARYPGQSQTGFVAALRAEADDPIARNLALGGAVTHDKAADLDETRVMLRLMSRY